MTRKHFYLVTEHEDDDRVGKMMVMDGRAPRSSKNEETLMHTFDEEAGDFQTVGKRVSCGYRDFEDEDTFEEHAAAVMKEKLDEIDTDHLRKAGLDPSEVLA